MLQRAFDFCGRARSSFFYFSFIFSLFLQAPMSSSVLTFAIVGEGDSPIFEADLAAPPSAAFTDAVATGDDENEDDAKDPSTSAASAEQQPPSSASTSSARDERAAYLHQFILHAALDAVDEVLMSSSSSSSNAATGGGGGGSSTTTASASLAAAGAGGAPHLGVVDRFNALQVSAYATPGSLRLLLLHDGRPDDVVRGFFKEVHEALVKARLNPFFIGGSSSSSSGNSSRSHSSGGNSLCCGAGSSGTGLTGLLAARGSGFDRRVRSLARSYFRVMV